MRSLPSPEGAVGDGGGQFERHGKDEPEVVIGMFPDQVDAAGGAEEADLGRRAEQFPKGFDHWCNHGSLRGRDLGPDQHGGAEGEHDQAAIEIHVGIRQRRPFGRRRTRPSDQYQADQGEEKARRHS